MDKLYSWSAKRAGGRITVTHSCGKIANVDTITVEQGKVVATDKDGRRFELHVPAAAGDTSRYGGADA